MKRVVAIAVATWLTISFFNFGALNAHNRRKHGWTGRDEAGIAAAFALMPIAGTGCAIFNTGFIEFGFAWNIGENK